MKPLSYIYVLLVLCSPILVQAQLIEFPEAELAQESVLPVFDKIEVVRERRVKTGERFEFGAGLGFSLTEALYDNKSVNFSLTYNLTNIHALNFTGMSVIQGLSNMGKDLQAGKGLLLGQEFDASLAPAPENYFLLNYQVTTYYGKISLSKDAVINLSLHGLLGAANVNFTDTSSVGFTFGFGQKFYFTNQLGLRMDLFIMAYSGPDPTSIDPTATTAVSSSDLDEKSYFPTFFNLSLVYIL